MDRRQRYSRLRVLTIAGPVVFVALGEVFRDLFLRRFFPYWMVSGIAVAMTLLAAVLFSWYMFRTIEMIESERRRAEEALSSLQERERIAREMHDGMAQNLSVLKFETYRLRELAQDDPRLWEELETIDKLINQTYLEVRQTLYDLRAGRWLDEGFWPTVQRQVAEFERQTGISVVVRPMESLNEPWNQLASVQILRIIQEALSNVRRHSGATKVHISCGRYERMVVFTIEDDGQGFEATPDTVGAHHYGLAVMRERADTIGAQFSLDSTPGNGTTIQLRIPLEWGAVQSGKS
jgi:signal transduction histidine kinase